MRGRRRREAESGSRVVLVALAGDLAIAAAKFTAFGLSGSSAILTEAIHSLVDSIDQVLLLVGARRARRHRDRSHPLGYGMEMYFWSFIVALFVFGAGGIASIVEGVWRLRQPEPPTSLALNLGVLGVAAAFEGWSFVVAFREYRSFVRRPETTLWTFIKASKDPSLFATLLEDSAALIGIGLAAAGILATDLLRQRWADGAALIAIGALMIAVAAVLANETRSLIAGEAVAEPIFEDLRRIINREPRVTRVRELATLQLGPKRILVALTAEFSDMDVDALAACIDEISDELKAEEDRVAYVYVRPVPSRSRRHTADATADTGAEPVA